ncbi:MAG TPA: serine hydrolase, partial [Sphingobacteriaceae bacterium]|nr:serine hydrolase [Sphingobacteriaceae bacterium]
MAVLETHRKKLLFILFFLLAACDVIHPLLYNLPDGNDYKRWPAKIIPASTNPITLTRDTSMNLGHWITTDDFSIYSNKITLNELASSYGTTSLLIIRNDTLVYEHYTKGYSENTIMPSFSIAKSFVSALVGISIDEGRIQSIDQSICDFLPELKKNGLEEVKISNLLNQTSGIAFSRGLNPGSDRSQNYYGRDLRADILEIKPEEKPGLHYRYSDTNTQLLGMILERANHISLSDLLYNKLWEPMGMQYDASWSIDNNKSTAIEKAFCGINARSIDFAKLGQLYLHEGYLNGKQILPVQWVKSTCIGDTIDGS